MAKDGKEDEAADPLLPPPAKTALPDETSSKIPPSKTLPPPDSYEGLEPKAPLIPPTNPYFPTGGPPAGQFTNSPASASDPQQPQGVAIVFPPQEEGKPNYIPPEVTLQKSPPAIPLTVYYEQKPNTPAYAPDSSMGTMPPAPMMATPPGTYPPAAAPASMASGFFPSPSPSPLPPAMPSPITLTTSPIPPTQPAQVTPPTTQVIPPTLPTAMSTSTTEHLYPDLQQGAESEPVSASGGAPSEPGWKNQSLFAMTTKEPMQ